MACDAERHTSISCIYVLTTPRLAKGHRTVRQRQGQRAMSISLGLGCLWPGDNWLKEAPRKSMLDPGNRVRNAWPKTAYLIDSIGFMFTKCQNRKSFIYNKLRDFRESLTYPHNELMRLCLLRWQSERRSAVLRPRWRVGITFSFNPRFLRVRTSDYQQRKYSLA